VSGLYVLSVKLLNGFWLNLMCWGGRGVATQSCEVNVIPYFTWLKSKFVFSKTARYTRNWYMIQNTHLFKIYNFSLKVMYI
jgi:hypothetical protein